jgi:hypothetical protein
VYFLAEAVLTWDPSRRDKARALLRRCAEEARERLATLR